MTPSIVKWCHAPLLLLIAEVLLCCVPLVVEARGRLELKMIVYNNPAEHDSSGGCCDLFCVGKCDHLFTFCLDAFSNNRDTNTCSYFKRNTGEFRNQNINRFTSDMQGVANPLLCTFNSWSGGAHFKVQVRDDDSSHSAPDDVDKLFYQVRAIPARTVSAAQWTSMHLEGTRSSDRTTLDMQMRLYCLADYYGHSCSTYCLARDSTTGHYTCHPASGAINCIPGWEDPSTRCTVFSDDCARVTCQHGGTCNDGNRLYTCTCTRGYTGRHCELNVDDCEPGPFRNDATEYFFILVFIVLPVLACFIA